MRDIGALLWVVIVIAGVISSIVSNARKQAARSQAVPRSPQPRPQPPPPAPQQRAPRPQPVRVTVPGPGAPSPAVAARPPTASTPPHEETLHVGEMPRPRARTSLFANRSAVARAVIAAEVLGKPRALRDEY